MEKEANSFVEGIRKMTDDLRANAARTLNRSGSSSMLLIADSGSTKTDWALFNDDGSLEGFSTSGLNPYQMSGEVMARILRAELTGKLQGRTVKRLFFYGAGCTPAKQPAMQQLLTAFLPETRIEVADDLLAAARALLGHGEGLTAILGTGANSCYYDGKCVTLHTPPLGYILGDEGSGAYLGKLLAANVAKRLFDGELAAAFWCETGLTEESLLQRVYREPLPNRFLAGLVPFIAAHRRYPQIKELLITSFSAFFRRNIAPYNRRECPVNFVGGIAHTFEPELRLAAQSTGFKVGLVEKRPLPRLVRFHAQECQLQESIQAKK